MEYISSRTNQKIKDTVKLINSSNERKEKELFVVEGATLAAEAVASNFTIEKVFFTSYAKERFKEQIIDIVEKALEAYEVSQEVAEKLSSMPSSQGIFCILKYIEENELNSYLDERRIIIVDSIMEPQNLGAIARSAIAFGFNTLVVSPDSSDWLSPRALRASMGALLHINVVITDTKTAISRLKENNFLTLAAAIKDNAIDISDVTVGEKLAIVIGNETNGLSEEIVKLCDKTVIIKTDSIMQSLNAAVAASILMYTQREKKIKD